MNNQAIGIIDDGFGGLAAVKELNSRLPHENIICLSDIENFPYEKHSKDAVDSYISKCIDILADKDVKLIINTCDCTGTTAVNSTSGSIPVIGIHLPAAQAACGSTKNGKIGIIGSYPSVQSGIISKAVKTIRPGTLVTGNASALIAPAVIDDYIHKNPSLIKAILEDCISPLKNDMADTIILGSAYCEFINEIAAELTGNSITLVSPVKEAVKSAELILFERGMLSETEENGSNSYLVNGNESFFKEYAAKLCGGKINGKIIS